MSRTRTRESSDEDRRAAARRRVAGRAKQGESPADFFSADDLSWAFYQREDELAVLERRAAEVRDQAARREVESEAKRELNAVTRVVLDEWDETEKRERRERAEEEARKRIAEGAG
jgi:hypothetical protein